MSYPVVGWVGVVPPGASRSKPSGVLRRPGAVPAMPVRAVLPDERLGRRVDRDHPVVVVVVDHEDAGGEPLDERRVVELAEAARGLVAVHDPAPPVELDDSPRVS